MGTFLTSFILIYFLLISQIKTRTDGAVRMAVANVTRNLAVFVPSSQRPIRPARVFTSTQSSVGTLNTK